MYIYCLGFTSEIKESVDFTSEVKAMDNFHVNTSGILLGTNSVEDFQPYRLYNSLLYLSRNGIDLSKVILFSKHKK